MTHPQRPIPPKLQAQVIRLRTVVKESNRIKKDYAVARGKHLLNFLRESARGDLNAVEVGIVDKLQAAGLDLDKCAEGIEEDISEIVR